MRFIFVAGLLLSAVLCVLATDAPASNVTVQVIDEPWDTGAAEGLALLQSYGREELDAPDAQTQAGPKIVCHTTNERDDLGGKCKYPFAQDQFWFVAQTWCSQFLNKLTVPTGQSFPSKLSAWNCGSNADENVGKKCDFLGNIRMDRDKERGAEPAGYNYIDEPRCMNDIQRIWDKCGGYGGYLNTAWGTIFMMCTYAGN